MKKHVALMMTATALMFALGPWFGSPASAQCGGSARAQDVGSQAGTKATQASDHAHAAGAMPDLVDLAAGAGSFKTLVAAVQAAGLVDVLRSDGPFTVFAPTDAAFAKLPAGTVEALLADKEKLTQILTYHVVPGRLMAADVVQRSSAKTVQGESIRITTEEGVRVNQANVVQTDIGASNGVIHVIDEVILPSETR